MPVTLTIKQVPDELAARLRALAARNHRSLQGELMRTLETMVALQDAPGHDAVRHETGAQVKAASPAPGQAGGDLLSALDAIVGDSRWGEAPLLSRDQANDRTLTREFEHLVQEREAAYRR